MAKVVWESAEAVMFHRSTDVRKIRLPPQHRFVMVSVGVKPVVVPITDPGPYTIDIGDILAPDASFPILVLVMHKSRAKLMDKVGVVTELPKTVH